MNTLPPSAYRASKCYQCSIYNRYNNITDIYIIICINIYSVDTFFETIETKGTIAKYVSAVICYQ